MIPIEDKQFVLFDAVGTLIYAAPPVALAYRDAGRHFGLDLPTEEISRRFACAFHEHSQSDLATSESYERQRWRAIVDEVFAEAGSEQHVSPTLFETLWDHFARPESWRMFDDAAECLQVLVGRGVPIGVASNFDARLRTVCAGHPLLRELPLFVSSELGFAKPHAEFFRTIENRLSTDASQITLVGDDWEADFRGATDAGWNCIFLDRASPGENGSIASLTQVPALLASGRS